MVASRKALMAQLRSRRIKGKRTVWLAVRERVPTFRSKFCRYKGVHKLLKKWYYRSYVFKKKEGTSKDTGAWRGRSRGRTVDHQISAWASGKKPKGRIHPYTNKMIKAFSMWGWTPICGQLVVSDDHAKVATAVDVVAADENGRLILIEVKCGGVGYLRSSTGKFQSPLGAVANHPLNQYFLQATMNSVLFSRTFNGPAKRKTYVVNVDVNGVERMALPKWAERAGKDMSDRLDGNLLT